MKDAVLYIHGKGGSAAECEHYRALFPDDEVFGLDYQTFTPWETGAEIHTAVEKLKDEYESIILIANSIGAYFSMSAGIDGMIREAYFISPIVDMEKLISDMMLWASVTEDKLKFQGVIHTDFGEDLSWDYLCYVRSHPVNWSVSTQILYGSLDNLTSLETIKSFTDKRNAGLTVMEGGEHWFHTDEQMQFLDSWIRKCRSTVMISRERLTPEEYIDFLKRTDLGSQYPRERFEERIARLVNSVSMSLSARNEDGRLIGVLLGLTDFAYWLYVTDLGVDRDYLHRGIGSTLMRKAHDIAGGERDIAVYLIANENAIPFYEKLGMKKAEDVMQYNHIEWTEFTVQ